MALIKDIYSKPFYEKLANSLEHSVLGFNKKQFINKIFTADFKDMEWKQRLKHTTQTLHHFMPPVFADCIDLMQNMISHFKKDGFASGGLEFMFLPDYVETYGPDDFKNAVKAFEFTTQYISCEFAVRPFIIKYKDKMMAQMTKWSLHQSAAVRRLASEGSRPRLPWAMAIPFLKKDPALVLPILENLKQDPSESVRRSVANNLNDIAKDHPNIVLSIAAKWKGISKETDAIIKHGSRTLLKQGHAEILTHYGLVSKGIAVNNFIVATPHIKVGDYLEFSFVLVNENTEPKTIRLEYAIHYKKNNGLLAKKMFKISERTYLPNQKETIYRKHNFKLITTKKFYAGNHKLSVFVNGEEKITGDFKLEMY